MSHHFPEAHRIVRGSGIDHEQVIESILVEPAAFVVGIRVGSLGEANEARPRRSATGYRQGTRTHQLKVHRLRAHVHRLGLFADFEAEERVGQDPKVFDGRSQGEGRVDDNHSVWRRDEAG